MNSLGQKDVLDEEIFVREMREEDTLQAAEIEQENFSMPWSQEGFLKAVQDSSAVYLVAGRGEEILGYIGMWTALDEGEITNVSVCSREQGKGIGKKLMKALEKKGKEAGVTAYFLEVRRSNQRAIRLYQSCGFEELGIRRNFYENPVEDACVMGKR